MAMEPGGGLHLEGLSVGKLPAPLALSLPALNKAAYIHLLSCLRGQDAQSAL